MEAIGQRCAISAVACEHGYVSGAGAVLDFMAPPVVWPASRLREIDKPV